MRVLAVILILVGLAGFGPWVRSAGGGECDDIGREGVDAYQRGDLAGLEEVLGRSLGCPDERFRLSLQAAALAWNHALALHQSGADAAAQEAGLARVLDFAPLWQAHAALGDMAARRGDHSQAAHHYQQALDSIASPGLTPEEPATDLIQSLFRKAQASRLLAPDYVPTSRSRSGEPTGLARLAIRSFGVREVAVPIQFVFDSVEFTPKGRLAATDLLDYLSRQDLAEVTLIGHADPVGCPDYNRRLSQRRAEAVAAFLRGQGFAGLVRTEGKGSAEPFVVDDPQAYSREEMHQLHRRVELRRVERQP